MPTAQTFSFVALPVVRGWPTTGFVGLTDLHCFVGQLLCGDRPGVFGLPAKRLMRSPAPCFSRLRE
jgi:hypothetical protein